MAYFAFDALPLQPYARSALSHLEVNKVYKTAK